MVKPAAKERLKLALVGSETLLGKEISEVVSDRTGASIMDFAATGEGNFGEAEGEALYVEPLEPKTISDARALVLAGTREGSLKAYELGKRAGGRLLLLDCTGHLEGYPEAKLVAPLAVDVEPYTGWLLTVAHPAASALALVTKRLARYRPLEQLIVSVFEPASEQGKRGVGELHRQTTSLLSFKPLEKQVFDSQLSFNLLSQYGEESAAKLSAVEDRISRQIAAILHSVHATENLPLPSLRVVGAPVFHGYSFSIWSRFAADINAAEVGEALACAQIEVRLAGDEPPDSVSAAGQSGLIAGDIRVDRNDPRAVWIWIVCDNLRLVADSVADLVSGLQRTTQ